MLFRAHILISLKEGVLDTQGKAVRVSLRNMGYEKLQEVRIGKSIFITVDAASLQDAEAQVTGMCDDLLVNPLIETRTVSLEAI